MFILDLFSNNILELLMSIIEDTLKIKQNEIVKSLKCLFYRFCATYKRFCEDLNVLSKRFRAKHIFQEKLVWISIFIKEKMHF